MTAEISSLTVIRAIRNLGGNRWPTAEEIAGHLEVKVEVVRPLLRGLAKQRLYRRRQRQGRQVWMPWEEP